jgi:hypothetical protein
MDTTIPLGTKQLINGQLRVYYYGYWIKAYDVPADTLSAKKRLIEALTRRLFNHVEHGLNIPGSRLEEARRSFEAEIDPQRKRVKCAMLAGALFNRAADIFTKLVEIQALGVEIQPDNALMAECGQYLQEALSLGKMVLHRSGDEGIDELWGEPFKAFSFPVEAFYTSRYIKIAQTMRDTDLICGELVSILGGLRMFTGIEASIREFGEAAKVKCETLRTDADIFDVWTSFVVSAEKLARFAPESSEEDLARERPWASEGMLLVRQGIDLVTYIIRARVPMPKSTREFFERCEQFRLSYCDLPRTEHAPAPRASSPPLV